MASKKNADDQVLELLKKVQEKKDEIQKAKERPNWKTNCSIPVDSTRINIQVIKSTQEIVNLYGYLNGIENERKEAAKELNVASNSDYNGFSFKDWKEDLKTRLNQITIDSKQKELDTLENRINSLITVEQRRAMELEQLTKILDS